MYTKRIIPCLDVKDGRVVKGTNFVGLRDAGDPVELAARYDEERADELVFLDITASSDNRGTMVNVARDCASKVFIPFTVGGGIRTMAQIESYLENGIDRVILGTSAMEDPQLLQDALRRYGERIAVGIDCRDGLVYGRGWLEASELHYITFAKQLEEMGVQTVIVTDISKDGLLSGTNLELYRQLSEKCKVDIVASGGVTTLDDVKKLAEMKLYGAILGKALYTGNIDLAAAVTLTKEGNE